MFGVERLTPSIGALLSGVDFASPLSPAAHDEIYAALIENLVVFIRGANPSPAGHLAFAQGFGELDQPHPIYPHVEDFENIVLLENDAERPPDTNSWHTDLTFRAEQPFASILVARDVPRCGGDTLWSSCIAAYENLPDGMRSDLENLQAIHDYGDFRNSFCADIDGRSGAERLDESVARFGHQIRPLIATHPVSGRRYLNFNEAFVTHIAGKTANESAALITWLANHMNRPEHQIRWRWQAGDLAMWDNRVTMHYALADYLPQHRRMHRVTVVRDRHASG